METKDWMEAARGIPVWPGCLLAFNIDDDACMGCSRYPGPGIDAENGYPISDLTDAIPDLSDSDTRAAYLRRLALALGCHQDQADLGVTHYYSRISDAWWLAAGDGTWGLRVSKLPPDQGLVAIALAWPAGKRVTQ